VKDRERTNATLHHERANLAQLAQAATLDAEHIRAKLLPILDGWRDPLGADVAQALQVLRKLLEGRLVFTPTMAADRTHIYAFCGRGVLDPYWRACCRHCSTIPTT
jgi:hypothetical protein